MSIDLWLTAAAILVLLVLSAFFSGSETALTAASQARMHQLEKNGDRRAGQVNRLRGQKDRLIGTLLLGNNLVNILASALATSVLLRLFGDAGIAYATLGMTLLVLIFSEVLPKTYALNNADRVALGVAAPVRLLIAALAPATTAINAIVRGLFALLGTRTTVNPMAALEELRGAIELHGGGNVWQRQQQAMLRSILGLADITVADVMVHRRKMMALDIDTPQDILIQQVLDSPYTRVPIWRDEPDNVIGVLHAKALLREVRNRTGDLDGIDIAKIAAPPVFVIGSTTLLDQLQAFRDSRAHLALVVDEYGAVQGLVTLEDILEEIVGDIYDELDRPMAGVQKAADGSYLVEGWVTLRDLYRRLGTALADEDAATLSGLVMYAARHIPTEGEEVLVKGFRVRVEARVRHQITRMRLFPPSSGGFR